MMTDVPVQTGDVLAGKYQVDRVLGVGGMGVVVAAHHLQLRDKVALKFLLPQVIGNKDIVARFLREAQAAVRIKSEHVARVIDVGTLESGAPYMVMEYLSGSDLSDLVKTRGPLPIDEALDYFLQACEAIAEAHSLGIVHRDLKPSNLFITKRADGSPLVKVLDFGISKAVRGDMPMDEAALTATSAVMGSPLYMSPEQIISAKHVDARADVWSLGVVLQELLTAEHPFTAETVPGLLVAISMSPPRPLRLFRPDAPQGLEDAIGRCLEKNPANRAQSVAELAQLLLPYAPARARLSVERIARTAGAAPESLANVASKTMPMHSPSQVTPAAAASAERSGPVQQTDAAWGETLPAAKRGSRLPIVIGGAAVIFLLGGVGAWKVTSKETPPSTATFPTTAAAKNDPTVAVTQVDPVPSAAVSSAPSSVAAPSVVATSAKPTTLPSLPRSATPRPTPSVAPSTVAAPIPSTTGTSKLIDSRK